MIILSILLPLIGSLFLIPIKETYGAENFARSNSIIKQIGLSTSLITLLLTIILFSQYNANSYLYQFSNTEFINNSMLAYDNSKFLPSYNLYNYNELNWPGCFAIDGISIYFVLLTAFITPICILSNWKDIHVKVKYFVFFFLLLETLQIAFFLVVDLLLFYIYFESVLIPLFMIVGIWGASKARIRAAFLLFLYTLGGSLPMLLAILWIYYNIGVTDFNYLSLFELSIDSQGWIWLAFFLAFAVKSPTYPFHLWLFRAHSEAPVSGSIILAATILKLATYGYLRVLLGVLPEFTSNHLYIIQAIAIITLIYSSLVTIRQTDTKAIVAYSSVAHVAIMILGLFSNNVQGIEGGILLSLGHGFVSPALFIIVGSVMYTRYHTRVINYYRGLSMKMPLFSIIFFLFIIFNASAPLSLNFVGEFLALTGIFKDSPLVGAFAATGIVLSAIYSIFLYNRISFLGFSPYILPEKITTNKAGKSGQIIKLGDLTRLELNLILPLLIMTVLLGLFPNVILDSLHFDITALLWNGL